MDEMVGKQLAGKKAEFAGDPQFQQEDRVFGFIQAETEQGQFNKRNATFFKALKDDYGIDVKPQDAPTSTTRRRRRTSPAPTINKMKSAGVTTIMLSADPLIPANLTKEATAQDYFPEWVIAPSVFVDTTIFGRTFDQQQWKHAFGLSLLTGPRPA